MQREFTPTWRDSRGSHGPECRQAFYWTRCRWCGQPAWYFECKHGSKVFFHDVPWWGGAWNSKCPSNPYHNLNDEIPCFVCGTFVEEGLLDQHMRFRHGAVQTPEYPLAAFLYYGPTDRIATKVTIGIFSNRSEIVTLRTWFSKSGDIRHNASISSQIADFLQTQNIKMVAKSDKITGCPHTEGVDYPKGTDCPYCLFWAKKKGLRLYP